MILIAFFSLRYLGVFYAECRCSRVSVDDTYGVGYYNLNLQNPTKILGPKVCR